MDVTAQQDHVQKTIPAERESNRAVSNTNQLALLMADSNSWGGDRYGLNSPGKVCCFALAIALVSCIALINPGDAAWIGDEPWLIRNALAANEDGRLAELGLPGTRGFTYGPIATWFYQALLTVSHNAVHLVLMRAAIVTAVTATSLVWIARTLRLSPWFAVMILLSPYLWFNSRILWDNNFNIPLAAAALASYSDFLKTHRPWALRLTCVCLFIMPFVHLMATAFVAPMLLHLCLLERRSVWQHRGSLLLILLILIVAMWPYLRHLLSERPSSTSSQPSVQAWLFALQGPRLISAKGLEILMGAEWFVTATGWQRTVFQLAPVLSSIVYVLCWLGMGMLVWRLVTLKQQRMEFSLRDHIGVIALGIWMTQTLLNGLSHTHGFVQYYNATWIAYAMLAWLAANSLSLTAMRTLVGMQTLAVATMLLAVIVRVHQTGGTRAWQYGPTISNQMQVASQMLKVDPQSQLQTNVENVRRFPYALQVLMKLDGTVHPDPRPLRTVVVRYTSDHPADAHIELVTLDPVVKSTAANAGTESTE